MPSCIVASHVSHPEPAAPSRVDAARGRVEVDAVLRVGRDRHLLGEREAGRRRGRRGRGRCRRPDRCARGRRSVSAACAKRTWRLAPVRTNASPSASARSCTPRGPKPPSGSSHAGVRIASPARDRREPVRTLVVRATARSSTPPLSTELTKCGDGASARRTPRTRRPRRASTSPSRRTPRRSSARAARSASWVQNDSGYPIGSSSTSRTTRQRRVLLADAAHRLPQHLLFVGEVEIHRSSSVVTAATRRRGGSRGCRRRRLAARCARCTSLRSRRPTRASRRVRPNRSRFRRCRPS